MTTPQICRLGEQVRAVAAKNCVLLLWFTGPKLADVVRVATEWKFKPTTICFVYAKYNPRATQIDLDGSGLFSGLGYWTNGNAEFCLLAKRGRPKRIARNVKQFILAPKGRHSVKPKAQYDRIERLVDGPYLELFGRQTRDGWTTLGQAIDGQDIHDSLAALGRREAA